VRQAFCVSRGRTRPTSFRLGTGSSKASQVDAPAKLAGAKLDVPKGAPILPSLRPLSLDTLLSLRRDVSRMVRSPASRSTATSASLKKDNDPRSR
jgi:hypothetical protein